MPDTHLSRLLAEIEAAASDAPDDLAAQILQTPRLTLQKPRQETWEDPKTHETSLVMVRRTYIEWQAETIQALLDRHTVRARTASRLVMIIKHLTDLLDDCEPGNVLAIEVRHDIEELARQALEDE